MRLLGSVLVLCLSSVALAETTVKGDRENGATLFRVQCAACHGVDGQGGGPMASKLPLPVGNLRGSAFLATRSDDDLRAAILKGIKPKEGVAIMPAAPWLNSLELADIIAFLRHGELRVADFFPEGQFLIAKNYPFDKSEQDRLQKLVGHSLSAAETRITVVSIYGDGHPGGPDAVPDDPVQLDKLAPNDCKGYLVFAELPQDRSRALYGIALDREGAVRKVQSASGLQNAALDKPYQAFLGLGDKKAPARLKVKAKGRGAPTAAEIKAFNDAYARALVGIGLADRDEKDRHWADTK
jgi:hypothetical protein